MALSQPVRAYVAFYQGLLGPWGLILSFVISQKETYKEQSSCLLSRSCIHELDRSVFWKPTEVSILNYLTDFQGLLRVSLLVSCGKWSEPIFSFQGHEGPKKSVCLGIMFSGPNLVIGTFIPLGVPTGDIVSPQRRLTIHSLVWVFGNIPYTVKWDWGGFLQVLFTWFAMGSRKGWCLS